MNRRSFFTMLAAVPAAAWAAVQPKPKGLHLHPAQKRLTEELTLEGFLRLSPASEPRSGRVPLAKSDYMSINWPVRTRTPWPGRYVGPKA
jgi:hypothetical protein